MNDPFLSLFVVIINAAILIVILNYTLSFAKKMQFTRGVSEMLGISLGIAALTFVLGYPIGAAFTSASESSNRFCQDLVPRSPLCPWSR